MSLDPTETTHLGSLEILTEQAKIQKLEAEREFSIQNARVAQIIADQEQITLDRARRQEQRSTAQDDQHFVYQFDDEVDHETVSKCVRRLMEWHRTNPNCDIEIQLNTFGGEMFSGFRLIDVIHNLREQGHTITTSVYGVAASMGAVILQAGTHRVAGKNAFLMLHQGSARVDGSIGDIEDDQELLKKLQARLLDNLAERSTLSSTKIKSTWNRKNWWINADEAMTLGFIDEIRGTN